MRLTRPGSSPKVRAKLDLDLPDLMTPGAPIATVTHGRDALWAADLGLADLIDGLAVDKRHLPYIRAQLMTLISDPAVLAWRQAILRDCVANPTLLNRLDSLLPKLADLRAGHMLLGRRKRALLLETIDRLSELDLYLTAVQDLFNALSGAALQAPGLIQVRDSLGAALQSDGFRTLQTQLPELQAPLSNLSSLTVGINLDSELRPQSVLLLSINTARFGESAPLLERLLGVRSSDDSESGIAPLHIVPSDPEMRPLSPLFQDLDRLTTAVAQPIARELERYVKASSTPLTRLEDQLAFYLAAARLYRKFADRGVAVCFPDIAPQDEHVTRIDGLINVNLALRSGSAAVASDAGFAPDSAIAILTGPNSGGKTTYLQAVGMAHVMAQTGLFVTAKSAQISPVDTILTHFPALETRQQGRLAEEADRLRAIFTRATADSLILLNESLSSTTPRDSVALAEEVLAAISAIGARAIFATHLVELVERIPTIEARAGQDSAPIAKLFSLIAAVEQTPDGRALPLFRVVRGTPLAFGYANEIARKHGLSFAQLIEARRANPADSR